MKQSNKKSCKTDTKEYGSGMSLPPNRHDYLVFS